MKETKQMPLTEVQKRRLKGDMLNSTWRYGEEKKKSYHSFTMWVSKLPVIPVQQCIFMFLGKLLENIQENDNDLASLYFVLKIHYWHNLVVEITSMWKDI